MSEGRSRFLAHISHLTSHISRCHALPPLDNETGAPRRPELPVNVLGSSHRTNTTAVHATQMAPGAHRRHVPGRITSSRRAELEMMRRDIPPAAYGAAAPEAIADVNLPIRNARAQKMPPGPWHGLWPHARPAPSSPARSDSRPPQSNAFHPEAAPHEPPALPCSRIRRRRLLPAAAQVAPRACARGNEPPPPSARSDHNARGRTPRWTRSRARNACPDPIPRALAQAAIAGQLPPVRTTATPHRAAPPPRDSACTHCNAILISCPVFVRDPGCFWASHLTAADSHREEIESLVSPDTFTSRYERQRCGSHVHAPRRG
jgi:hypothetical protein